MDVYLVSPGDTLYQIASRYRVPMAQMIQDNALRHPDQLVVGQALIIRQPTCTRSIRTGDTLRTIAEEENLSLSSLLRQNVNQMGREQIVPGQSLVLSYPNSGSRRPLTVLGCMPPKSRQDIMPFLTAPLSPPYRFTLQGILVPPVHQPAICDGQYDENRPILTVQDRSDREELSRQLVRKLLNDQQVRQTFIDQLKTALAETDSQGTLISFLYLAPEDAHNYVQFIEDLHHSLPDGVTLMVTLPAGVFGDYPHCGFACGQIAQTADLVLVTQEPPYNPAPGPLPSLPDLEALLQRVLAHVSPDKCVLELSDVGCDWVLPYRPDIPPTPLSPSAAVELAWKYHAAIRRNPTDKSPWFRYTDHFGQEHQVHFQDSASLLPQLALLETYGLYGLAFLDSGGPAVETLVLLDSKFHIRETLK